MKNRIKLRSRSGFTLVELVVVIAVLGVIAAIAIPSVIGIIHQSRNAASESGAGELDRACREFYAGVMAGTINKDNTPSSMVSETLPNAKDTVAVRRAKAKTLKIRSALQYSGMTSKYPAYVLSEYYFIEHDGTIVFKDTTTVSSSNLKPVGMDTGLSLLYET